MKSQLAVTKNRLFHVAHRGDGFNTGDANVMISDANSEAYDKLSMEDRGYLNAQKDRLIREIPNLGEVGALELLAAIGAALNEFGEKEQK